MNRQIATKQLRDLLDEHGLKDWHVRLTTDFTKPFLGLCSHKDKCIILNAHHIDSHPDIEVIDTIRHEVAHALVGAIHQHDETWKAKAIELGALPQACATMALSPIIIDQIRSGADVQVDFEETTHVVRTPKYHVTRLQDKCPTCGKVAKTKRKDEIRRADGTSEIITELECGHFIFTHVKSASDYGSLIFDGDPNCQHVWGRDRDRTICQKCNAKRLYEYQIDGARAIERANGRFALFDEQGLGKTIQAIAWMYYNKQDAFPYLWVTKSGILVQHAREIVRILGKEAFPQMVRTSKTRLIPKMSGYIISYDLFRRLPNLDMFKEVGVKTLILDECQAIKNPDSSRTQALRKVAREIPHIIPLSGTPWKNRGSEFFVVLNMLDPKTFYSYEHFKNTDVNYYWDGNRQKEGGIRNPAKFKEKIAHIAVRRERKDVMPELPLISRRQLITEVPEHARKAYNEEKDALVNTYNQAVIGGEEDSMETHRKIMENLVRMRQIVGLAKIEPTVEFATEFLEETDRKLVIFVHHINCGEILYNQIKNWCIENHQPLPLRLSADMNAEQRYQVQADFNGPNHRVLIASTLASGEGLNLQSCSDCIMMERQWNPANEEQAEGRFIRIGQMANAVTATYVHGDDTIDTILDGIVETKRREFSNAMNKDGYTGTWTEQSIIKQLAQALASGKKLSAA